MLTLKCCFNTETTQYITNIVEIHFDDIKIRCTRLADDKREVAQVELFLRDMNSCYLLNSLGHTVEIIKRGDK